MGNRIRELREEEGISQTALARQVGVSQQKISQIELNTERMDIRLLVRLSQYFSVSTDYILGISENRRSGRQEETLQRKMREHAGFLISYNNLNKDNRRMIQIIMDTMGKTQKESEG